MPTLWITAPHTSAALSSERLTITPLNKESDLTEKRSIPLIDIDLVVTSPHVQLSSNLIYELCKRSIPLLFLDHIGRPLGQCLPHPSPHPATRLIQYQLQQQSHTHPSNHIAANLIAAKIYNQRRVLQRLRLNRSPGSKITIAEHRLSHAINTLQNYETSPLQHEQILGTEGYTSADFYSDWKIHLPDEFPFQKRSRRPPLNPVNACLSFLSTLLYQEMLAATFAASLDASLGHLHTSTDGRWSLPLDLIEPFRPIIVESTTLDLFCRGQLSDTDFHPAEGGIYLNNLGRKKVILAYEKRIERYFHSEHLGQRSSLRTILRNTPLDYKAHINDKRPFSPFRMN